MENGNTGLTTPDQSRVVKNNGSVPLIESRFACKPEDSTGEVYTGMILDRKFGIRHTHPLISYNQARKRSFGWYGLLFLYYAITSTIRLVGSVPVRHLIGRLGSRTSALAYRLNQARTRTIVRYDLVHLYCLLCRIPDSIDSA